MGRQISRCNKRGFTFIEIMVIVLIMGILLAIGIPNFLKARRNGCTKACIHNMRQMEGAKEEYAMEYNKSVGDPIDWDKIVPSYLKEEPECPAGGLYTLFPIGDMVDCSFTGHDL